MNIRPTATLRSSQIFSVPHHIRTQHTQFSAPAFVIMASWDEFSLPSANDADCTSYGHALKDKYFLLEKEYCNLNHGSYGTVPRPVLERQQQFHLEQEARPDAWFRENYFKHIERARAALAEVVGSSVQNLVLVENASSAITSVVRSLGLQVTLSQIPLDAYACAANDTKSCLNLCTLFPGELCLFCSEAIKC